MPLTLENFREQLPAPLIKKAAGIHVRECDEISPGCFQAYADQKDKSFDVSVTFDKKGTIIDKSCDCGRGDGICQHIAALMMFLTQADDGAAPKRKRKKKVDPLTLLIEETDETELREWVAGLLKKNKDLALAFQEKFSGAAGAYTPQRVAEITRGAVTSVSGRRKKLDVSEVKKIISLWNEVHAPIIAGYLRHPTDPETFLNIVALLNACIEVALSVATTSKRMDKYPADLLEKLKAPLHDIQVESSWQKAVDGYIALLGEKTYHRNHYLLDFLVDMSRVSGSPRSTYIASGLMKWFDRMQASGVYMAPDSVHRMFEIAVNHGLFREKPARFKPVTFDNAYNIALIDKLIETGELGTAARYCDLQITGNFREEYNTPYLKLLKRIYTLQGDGGSLAVVTAKLFPTTMAFEDFMTVYDALESAEEKSRWKTKALHIARNHSRQDAAADRFIFRMFSWEKKYKQLLESINYHTPYSLLAEFAEPLIEAEADLFLMKLLTKPEYDFWEEGSSRMKDRTMVFERLGHTLGEHYSTNTLKKAVKKAIATNPRYGRPSAFTRFLDQKLR
jgi:hypothetical protein